MLSEKEKDLETIIKTFAEFLNEELDLRKGGIARKSFIKKIAHLLRSQVEDRKFRLFARTLFEVSEKIELAPLERYIKSVYFSGDYEKFRKTTPSEVVRMMRFYFKRKDGTPGIPIEYVPAILKRARVIKQSIMNTIKHRAKKSTIIPKSAIFEQLKEEFLNEKKTVRVRKKRKSKK